MAGVSKLAVRFGWEGCDMSSTNTPVSSVPAVSALAGNKSVVS